jgi:uncharacterized protein (UPF0276 family)
VSAGIGLRHPHHAYVLEHLPPVGWFEIHSENFFVDGGPALSLLDTISQHYPISFHSVGLSLGSATGVDMHHLQQLARLVCSYPNAMISDHVSWSMVDGIYSNDLLPVPLTEESACIMISNIIQVQDYLKRQILIENPSSYLSFSSSTIDEWDFMNLLIAKSGCGILLDVNNIYVSSINHGFDAHHYINQINCDAVQEIHLAGHMRHDSSEMLLLLDHHGDKVCDEVWDLYRYTINKLGPVPTLIEWDTDIPEFAVLEQEAAKAQTILDQALSCLTSPIKNHLSL